MTRPFIVGQGDIAAAHANDFGDYIDVPLPFHKANDILVLTGIYYPSPEFGAITPATPNGWTAGSSTTYPNADRGVTSWTVVIWWWRRATDSATPTPRIVRGNPTGAADSSTHLSGNAFVVRGCVEFGDPFEGRARNISTGSSANAEQPALTSTHAESLGISMISSAHSGVANVGSHPQGFTTVSAKYSYLGDGAAVVLMTRPLENQTIPASLTGYSVITPFDDFNQATIFVFSAIGAATLDVGEQPVTSVPIRGMGPRTVMPARLGCASEYEAIITSNDYETRLAAVRWGSIEWERVLDEVSTATVVIPDEYGGVSCVAKYGGLKPWRFGMTIERNGMEVWKGPVTSVARRGGAITVGCQDALVRFKKRFATRSDSLRYVANDVGQMFADLLNIHGRVPTDAFEFKVPQADVDVAITRTVVAREFNMSWDIVEELLNSAIDAYVLAGVPIVFQPGYGWIYVGPLDEQYYLNTEQAMATSTGGDTLYGLFTQEAFKKVPDWSINGMVQANTAIVPGADSGQAGFRKYWQAQVEDELVLDSVLDMVETTQLYRPGEGEEEPDESVFQRRADGLVALRAIAPAVIDSVELSEDAPINVENLRPGSIWLLDVYDAGWGQLLGAGRVKRVGGKIDATTPELVTASLQPLGYTEADL